jgi:hypothetical protein
LADVFRSAARRGRRGDRCFPEDAGAGAGPGALVRADGVAEGRAALALEERPRHRQIAGVVAHSGTAEVDDGRQPVVLPEQVARGDLDVEARRRVVPGRAECSVPRIGGQRGVDEVAELLEGRSGLLVVTAAAEVVRFVFQAARRAGRAQRDEGPGEVVAESCESSGATSVTGHPTTIRTPTKAGESRGRLPCGQWSGNRERKPRGEDGQPAVLLLHLDGVNVRAGQAARLVAAFEYSAVVTSPIGVTGCSGARLLSHGCRPG